MLLTDSSSLDACNTGRWNFGLGILPDPEAWPKSFFVRTVSHGHKSAICGEETEASRHARPTFFCYISRFISMNTVARIKTTIYH